MNEVAQNNFKIAFRELSQSLLEFVKSSSFKPEHTVVLLFILPNNAKTKFIVKILQSKVRSNLNNFIEGEELYFYFLSLCALYKHSPSIVDGKYLANAITLLTKSEVVAGGPYQERHGLVLDTNLIVYLFLKQITVVEGTFLTNSNKNWVQYNHTSKQFTRCLKTLSHINQPLETKDYYNIFSKMTGLDDLPNSLKDVPEHTLVSLMQKASHHLNSRVVNYESIIFVGLVYNLFAVTSKSKNSSFTTADNISEVIYKQLKDTFSGIEYIGKQLCALVDQVKKADHSYEISLLPYLFSQQINTKLSMAKIENLGKANICLWVSYTIYDNVLDNEGSVQLLPIANIAMRKALFYYSCVSRLASDTALVEESFRHMDAANNWELQNCRADRSAEIVTLSVIPDYGNLELLARRAQGHLLGPLLIYRKSDKYTWQGEAKLHTALDAFLIAKQINDDIHDWQADLIKGNISWAVAFMLTKLKITPGTYSVLYLQKKMAQYFWNQGCLEILTIQKTFIQKSKTYFQLVPFLDTKKGTAVFLEELEHLNKQGIKKYNDQHLFFTEYASITK